MNLHRLTAMLFGATALLVGAGVVPAVPQPVPLSKLRTQTHVHGLAVDRQDPAYLLIATHHGLFRAGPDGSAERISVVQDFMGFNPHPNDPATLYASGHPAEGGNLGFISSTDGGKSWKQISPGADGPVDFHQITISPADPDTIFGVYGSLQVSRDAGRTWANVGSPPDKLIDLAASSGDPNTLYAATESGLSVSRDSGVTWETVLEGAPVSMIEASPDGSLYAFAIGRGLVKADEGLLDFQTVSSDWGDRFILHLAIDPNDPARLFGATQESAILASVDGGRTWAPFGR